MRLGVLPPLWSSDVVYTEEDTAFVAERAEVAVHMITDWSVYEDEEPPSLTLQPRPRTPPSKPCPSFDQQHNISPSLTRLYPSIYKIPIIDPHETLCHSYNVARTTIEIPHNTPLPSQLDIPVLQDAHMPTHVLAILSTPRPSESSQPPAYLFPIIAPINAELFAQTFNKDVTHLSSHLAAPGSTMPIPSWDEATQRMVVTVPVIPLSVPHPYSMPLLLFFGLGLHRQYEPQPSSPRVSVASSSSSSTRSGSPNRRRSSNAGFPPGISTNLLSTYLLPIPVIEEFPAAAAMSRKMEEVCTEEELHTRVEFNRGLWRNILSLAPKDVEIIDIAHMAWNITADARRLRDRLKDLGLR